MQSSLRIIYSLIVFIFGIVMLSALTVLLIYENRETNLSFDQVNQSNLTRHSLERVFSMLKDAESTHRNFLITNDSSSLATYQQSGSLEAELLITDSLLQKNDGQIENLHSLRTLIEKQRASMDLILKKISHPGYRESSEFYANLKTDHENMIGIGKLIETMQKIETQDLAANQQDVRRHRILPAVIGICISIFSIIVFILAFYFTNSELKKSNRLNDELETKNIQLEKYTQELSSFTNLISHDMQEPLRKIELFISIIEDREKERLSPKALEHFEKIKSSVGRMRQLFFSIVSFAFADQVRNVREEVDLNDVLGETMENLKVYIRDTNAVISADPLPFVSGVKYQLVQAFQNLVSNSLKYKRPDLVPEIQISCEVVDGKSSPVRDLSKEKQYYRISFRDNGTGFDQKYVDKIFDIFQRHIRNENNGLGIGLSVCRKIAHNHDGTITAESDFNKGSLFSLYLPVPA